MKYVFNEKEIAEILATHLLSGVSYSKGFTSNYLYTFDATADLITKTVSEINLSIEFVDNNPKKK